ncbi:hypothetical protein IT575_00670 [bacterium]|nr:hypothetical protein [bacterium]
MQEHSTVSRQSRQRAGRPSHPPRPGLRLSPPLTGLLLILALLMLAPPQAGDQGLAVPVRYAKVRLSVRAPSLLRLDLPAGQYFVSPASLGYFSQNNEFVFTSDVQRGLVYGYLPHDPAAAPGDNRGAVYLVEISAPSESDLFLGEYLDAIRGRVDQENLAANQLRLAREQDSSEPLKARRLAAQPLAFSRKELSEGAFSEWVERVLHDYGDLVDGMPAALQAETVDQIELKRLYYQAEAACMDQMLASFELQMTLAKLPKPRIESLIQLGDSSTVQEGGLKQLMRMREGWLLRQDELQQELAQSRLWLEGAGGRTSTGRQPFGFPAAGGQLPDLGSGGLNINPRSALERSVISSRVSLAEAELREISQTLRLADGLKRYIDQGGSGRNNEGFKLLSVPRSAFAPLSVEQLDGFALVEGLARDNGACLPLLLRLARAFEGLDSAKSISLPAMQKQQVLNGEDLEVSYALLLVDRATRIGGPEPAGMGRREAEPAGTEGGADAMLDKQLGLILADPSAGDMADSNLGFVAFMNWYGEVLRAGPESASQWAAPAAPDKAPAAAADTGGNGRQPSAGRSGPREKALSR